MNGNKKPTLARVIPPPFNRPAGSARPFKPGVAQLKTAVSSQGFKRPFAPPVYRPQPVPKVLQAKRGPGQIHHAVQPPRQPVAPPVYRPQAKKIVQPKMISLQRKSPSAPVVYRPQPVPRVSARPASGRIVQPKTGVGPAQLVGGAALNRLHQATLSAKTKPGGVRDSNGVVQRLKLNDAIRKVQQNLKHDVSNRRAPASALLPRQPWNGGVAQRKIGFELETDNKIEAEVKGLGFRPYGRKKGAPIYVDPGKFSVEADTHCNMEFIIKEQDNWNDLEVAVEAAVNLAEQINADTKHGAEKHIYPKTGNWTGRFQIIVTDTGWEADGQATLGVQLRDVRHYLRTTLSGAEWKAHTDSVGRAAALDATPAVAGLTRLIIQFVLDFQKWKGGQGR